MHPYTLIRSRRKTIAIHITAGALVEVRAPLRAPKSAIDAFVASKAAWITARLTERRDRINTRASFELNYGDKLPLCGQVFPIRAGEGSVAGFDDEGFFVPPKLPPEQIMRAVVTVYKCVAKSVLTKKTEYYALKLGVTPLAVKINSAKTRWGSCSGKNSINYSWRLVMADDEAVDYVVVHELAHILEHNHSSRFWEIVQSILPDHMQRRARLRELSEMLAGQAWD